MSELRDLLGPDLMAAVERLVDDRVAAALADRENGSSDEWLTLEEAAAALKVSRRTVARMLRDGRLDSTCVGRRRLVRRSDLERQSG